jgi:hypothetical protein
MPYPYTDLIGERYAVDNDPNSQFYQPPCDEIAVAEEGRARVSAGLVLDDLTAGPRGRVLRPTSQTTVSQYGEWRGPGSAILSPFYGTGGVRRGESGVRGRLVRPWLAVGCRRNDAQGPLSPGFVIEEWGDDRGIVPSAKRIQENASLQAYLDLDSAGARGRVLRLKGLGGCPNEIRLGEHPFDPVGFVDPVWSYGDAFDTESPYHFDVFGQRCVSCPILFVTYERPCIDCSYRPVDRDWALPPDYIRGNVCHHEHTQVVTDFCAEGGAGPLDLGEAHCIPSHSQDNAGYTPDYHIGCDLVDDDGTVRIGEHHCEECVFERNLGFLIRIVLNESDVLSKVPMRPIRYRQGPCDYGCGAFGWTLWGGGRIPWEGWPHSGVDEIWDEAYVTIQERSCESDDCFTPGAQHESGFGFCGTGFDCECPIPFGFYHCTTTHQFRWNRFSSRNRVTSAYLCFRQWEACNRADPCPSDINQGVDPYHNPPAQLMVWVNTRIRLQLEFDHWGPKGDGVNATEKCGCCLFNDIAPDSILVTIVGEFCGPVPWGDLADPGWIGFESDDLQRQADYPGVYGDPITGSDHRGNCGAMFVDQGTYGDRLDGERGVLGHFDLFDEGKEPPRRCPSYKGGRFYCPPSMRWSWSYTVPPNTWAGSIEQPNQRHAKEQCWSLQLIKNDGDGCAGGRINSDGSGVDAIGCHNPNCRRGCSLRETRSYDGSRISPWELPRATPWGCEHCVTEYPLDPLVFA